jgi:hypothetical protein
MLDAYDLSYCVDAYGVFYVVKYDVLPFYMVINLSSLFLFLSLSSSLCDDDVIRAHCYYGRNRT